MNKFWNKWLKRFWRKYGEVVKDDRKSMLSRLIVNYDPCLARYRREINAKAAA